MAMNIEVYVIVGAVNPMPSLPAVFLGVSVIRKIFPSDPGTYSVTSTLVQPSDPVSAGMQNLNLDLAKNSAGEPLIFLDEASATTWLNTSTSGDVWRRAISAHAIVNVNISLP